MRKTVLTLAFFIILSLSLSGCDEKKEEKLVLTILTEREYEDQVKVARHGFNEKYDDVEVKIFYGSINEVAECVSEDIEDGCPIIS